jgi:hypothetical protein
MLENVWYSFRKPFSIIHVLIGALFSYITYSKRTKRV